MTDRGPACLPFLAGSGPAASMPTGPLEPSYRPAGSEPTVRTKSLEHRRRSEKMWPRRNLAFSRAAYSSFHKCWSLRTYKAPPLKAGVPITPSLKSRSDEIVPRFASSVMICPSPSSLIT